MKRREYLFIDNSGTPYGNRVWVHFSLSLDLRMLLDYFSKWNGSDKAYADYLSWELKPGTEEKVYEIFNALKYKPVDRKEVFGF